MLSKCEIKNYDFVCRMSFRQKVMLLTGTAPGENCPVEKYAFPAFKLSSNPAEDAAGLPATLFPSDRALACTWNTGLVKDVYHCIGNEAKANVPNAYYNVSNALTKENVSCDSYFTGSFLAGKALGLKLSGVCVNFEHTPDFAEERVLRETVNHLTDPVLREAEPTSVTVQTPEEAKYFLGSGYSGLVYGTASTKEEAARYLFEGCSFVFLKEDFTEELVSYLSELTFAYEKAAKEYGAGNLPLAELDRRQRNLDIFDESLIDAACGRMVELMLRLKANNPASVREKAVSLVDSRTAKFNERHHDLIAYRAAQQSVVLLKNKGVLPLGGNEKLAVLGEYAKNEEYQTELTRNEPTAVLLPFDAINGYGLNAIGYAHGYLKGEGGASLIAAALELCAKADYALVYLCARVGARALPKEQTELLDALAQRGVKIIAVVSSDGGIDFSFAAHCEAVLYCPRGGQGVTNAVLDVLTGIVNPSGKLTESFASGSVCYPFGFGLSYTTFEYRNLRVNERGASVTVVNTGTCDGFATVQLYVQKNGSESTLSEKRLRGFAKLFVKKGEAVKAEIPFDSDTFKAYDINKKKYLIEGGEYRITIGDSAETEKLSGEFKLSRFVYDAESYESEREERTDGAPVGFTDTPAEAAIRMEKKGISFGVKLFLAVVLMLYYNALGCVLLITNIVAIKTLPFYISVGVLMLIGDILAIVYIVVISKKRKYQRYQHPNDVLSDMVAKVPEFDEIAKLSFAEPLPAEEKALQEEEAPEGEEVSGEAQSEAYEVSFETHGEEENVFKERTSFSELCNSFRAYALGSGVAVESSSARALISAVLSSKLVLLTCKNQEALPDLVKALCGYFVDSQEITTSCEWQSRNDILWRKEGDKFVASPFANLLNAASGARDKYFTAVLCGVMLDNLYSYFGEFLDYALTPTEEHTLEMGGGFTLRIPENFRFVLAASESFTVGLPEDLVHASLHIEVLASKTEPAERETESKVVSRSTVEELLSAAREKHYLPEKIWKKIDALSEAVGADERFEIGNKDILQLEKFTAILLDSGADESETLTDVFTAKLVPLLKNTKIYRGDNGGKTISGIIEKLFPDEDVSKITKSLMQNA